MTENGNYKILIVDDEQAILRTLSTYLDLQGYDCVTFDDPLEALEWLNSNTAHIIITDLVMGKIDGLELIERLQKLGTMSQLIVMTAYSSMERAILAYRMGVNDYLLKPFNSLDEVGEVVGQASKRLGRWKKVFERALDEENSP